LRTGGNVIMATLRRDSFTHAKPKGDRGRSSFYGMNRHTGITMTPPKTPFTAALDDVYGTHVVFGDEAKKRRNDRQADTL